MIYFYNYPTKKINKNHLFGLFRKISKINFFIHLIHLKIRDILT